MAHAALPPASTPPNREIPLTLASGVEHYEIDGRLFRVPASAAVPTQLAGAREVLGLVLYITLAVTYRTRSPAAQADQRVRIAQMHRGLSRRHWA